MVVVAPAIYNIVVIDIVIYIVGLHLAYLGCVLVGQVNQVSVVPWILLLCFVLGRVVSYILQYWCAIETNVTKFVQG